MATPSSYIVLAKRSPIGKFLGGLSKLTAVEIGTQVARKMLESAGVDPAAIDEVLVGHVVQAGCGQNPARQVALGAGCPNTISACTINKVCGSGLQSVMYADQVIRAGDADVVLAGGIESMSQAPHLIRGTRSGLKFGDATLVDALIYDGLINVYDGEVMGNLAEETAELKGITRQDQDQYAATSHQRAGKADADGLFDEERIAIEVRPGKPPVERDEGIRPDTTPEALAALKPAFRPGGTVTAGNASQLSDGAAFALVCSEAGLKRLGLSPLARIVAHATSGLDPREVFLTPIPGCRMVCEKAGWSLGDVDLWEINEAFAAEMVAVLRGLELSTDNVNVHGGAIALGHPLGASGTRCLVTLLHAMKHRNARRGVVALCLGGGNAVAMAVEQQ